MDKYKTRVRRGAKTLDRYYKGEKWWRLIEPDNLMMQEYNRCVLGQLFGEYSKGCELLGRPDDETFGEWPIERGFETENCTDAQYAALVDAWREYLKGKL